MSSQRELLEQIEMLQNLVLTHATGGHVIEGDYERQRERVLADPLVRDRVPRFVRTCRSLGQFWNYIKGVDGTYAGRRTHIWAEFAPVLEFLEAALHAPGDTITADALKGLDESEITLHWQRALERREKDPEGAITAARTLVESVCKIILEDLGCDYPPNADLPKLYSLVADQLHLAPKKHDEDVFKRILGGAQTVVDGLATVRNRYGDSHGKGKRPVKPLARHATLAVNMAGAMAAFLAATHREREEEP